MTAKLLALIWREIYITYTDRSSLLILLVTPLALATIIGSAFSGLIGASGNDVPISNIPVVVVNLDQGVEQNGQIVNNGMIFVDALVAPVDASAETLADNPLFQLTDAVTLIDADTARAGVRAGDYAAAIIIPADFSASLSAAQDDVRARTTVEIYASDAVPISANVMRSVVLSISNQIMTGNIAAAATLQSLFARFADDPMLQTQFLANAALGLFNPDFDAALEGTSNSIQIEQQTVQGEIAGFNPLVTLGSAQAVFFMTFTALGGVTSLLDERKDGTLPRLIMTPTPRWLILIGKITGVFLNCVIQVTLLILALAVVGIILQGEVRFIWGSNILGLISVILAIALAASGIGAVVAGLARTSEQANTVTTVIALSFAVLGGAFFTVDAIVFLRPLTQLTPNHWAVNAFTKLSQNQNDIGLNLIILIVMGVVLLTIGVVLNNRRMGEA